MPTSCLSRLLFGTKYLTEISLVEATGHTQHSGEAESGGWRLLLSQLSPLYTAQDPSPWNGATYKVGFPTLNNPIKTIPHR